MAGLLKSLLGRPYSYEDLLNESTPFLTNPRLPDGWSEVLPHLDGLAEALFHSGGKKLTFLEITTLLYKDFLRQVSAKPTRAEQRTELLSLHIQELTWRAAEKASRDAKHLDSWAHFANGSGWFEPYPKTEWKRILAGRYMASIILGSWLLVLGKRLYQLEDYIEAALDLFLDYDTEIKTMDVGMMELMLENIANHDNQQGLLIGDFKEEVINPLIQEQYAILDKLAADIKKNTFNVDFYKTQFTRIDEIKQQIARTMSKRAMPSKGIANIDTDIFISYRRDDEPAFVGRLYDYLRQTFPRHPIFIDTDAIPPGADFLEHITNKIEKCSVFLLVIGPKWLITEAGINRLFDHNDVVRHEIEAALGCNCLIIPVKTNGAILPLPREIPPSISKLSALNTVGISHARFRDDARPLIRAIKARIRHPIHKHLSVEGFEYHEWEKSLGMETMADLRKAVYTIMDSFSEPFVRIFLRETRAAIASKDALKFLCNQEAFSDAMSDAKGGLIKQTFTTSPKPQKWKDTKKLQPS